MLLISANPTTRHKRAASPKGATVKKRRSAAQKAATKRMIAANRRGKKVTTNPRKRKYHAASRRRATVRTRTVRNPVRRRRVIHRNPGLFSGGGVLKEIFSIEGAMMIGAAMAAPMVADYVQEKVMPTATGWTRILVKAGIIAAGTFAIQKFLKKPKVALAFGVTGAAVLASDAVNYYRGAQAGLTTTQVEQADTLAGDPVAIHALASGYNPGTLSDSYNMGLSDPYASAFSNAFGD